MLAHQIRFVVFQRTGVRFLLRDTHRGQRVKNFLALDFQLTGQIVDSNLTHPLSFPLLVPPMLWFYARISNLAKSLSSLTSGSLLVDEARAFGSDRTPNSPIFPASALLVFRGFFRRRFFGRKLRDFPCRRRFGGLRFSSQPRRL